MKNLAYILFLFAATPSMAQTGTWSEKMAQTIMTTWKDGSGADDKKPQHWNYDQGVFLKGIEGLWYRTGDARYFTYIQHSMDVFVGKDGSLNTYKLEDYNIDNICSG